jgi:hypothetical protein
MSAFLRLLLIACVLWCGAHVAQPAWAHDEVAHHQADAALDDEGSDHKGSADAAHIAHHHCPAALHQNAVAALDDRACGAPLLFAARTAPLASRSQAPPIEPPAA